MTWFAIRTSPQREFALVGRYDEQGKWAAGILERRGYACFLPTETRSLRPRSGGKRKLVVYPLFTGYIFVKGPIPWLHLMSERHVIGYVGLEGAPYPISEASIERLRQMSGGSVPNRKSVNTRRSFVAGDLAEISVGPFRGQVVKITDIKGKNAKILLSMFGDERRIDIAIGNLEAA